MRTPVEVRKLRQELKVQKERYHTVCYLHAIGNYHYDSLLDMNFSTHIAQKRTFDTPRHQSKVRLTRRILTLSS